MTEYSLVDIWLDKWEQFNQHGQAPPLETFIAEYCSGAPELIDAFRERALGLRSMDQRLRDLASTLSSQRSDTGNQAFPGSLLQPGQAVRGYRLERKMGRGGFGEVWRAIAPDGTPVALKYVLLDRSAALAELRGLDILQKVSHSQLITVSSSWQHGDALIIVMELADRTLRHRYQEALHQGHPGVPRDELFGYMDEAARGIDFLNHTTYESPDGKKGIIGHRDIKPDNLLLKGTSLKIGDFGLARCLERPLTSHTGSMTVAYAAPEIIDGKSSKFSDQYSLAVTYCEMRTGQLPFSGSKLTMMQGHASGVPDLAGLPPEERPVVARALSKKGTDRWPSCCAFVEALRQASDDAKRYKEELAAQTDAEAVRASLLADLRNVELRHRYLAVRTKALRITDAQSAGNMGCLTFTAVFTSLSIACCIWILSSVSSSQEQTPDSSTTMLLCLILGTLLGALPGMVGANAAKIGEGAMGGGCLNLVIAGVLIVVAALAGRFEPMLLVLALVAAVPGGIAGALGGAIGKLKWSELHAELGPLPPDAPTNADDARRAFLPPRT